MKRVLLMISCLVIHGCMESNALKYSAIADNNICGLSRIYKGMCEREVIKIMHKPFKYETFVFGDDVYDVWFYVTRTTVLDQTRMVPQNLTPLTFKNGRLVGMGYDYYNYLTHEQQGGRKAKSAPPVKKEPPRENKGIEKALEAPKSAPTAPQPLKEQNPEMEKALTPPKKPVTMSKKPKDNPQEETEEETEKVDGWDRKGEKMEDQEQEQDFDYW